MLYIPFTSNPIGWAILGIGGYVLYKQGKKKGEEEAAAAQIIELPEPIKTEKDNRGDE